MFVIDYIMQANSTFWPVFGLGADQLQFSNYFYTDFEEKRRKALARPELSPT